MPPVLWVVGLLLTVTLAVIVLFASVTPSTTINLCSQPQRAPVTAQASPVGI